MPMPIPQTVSDKAALRAGGAGRAHAGRWTRRGAAWRAVLLVAVASGTAGPIGAQRGDAPDGPAVSFTAPRTGDGIVVSSNARCLACHAMPGLGYRDSVDAPARTFTIAAEAFRSSVHGTLACSQCHPAATTFPHPAGMAAAPATCDGDCHATDSLGAPYSHRREAAELAASVHGRPGDPDAPQCLTCHGAGDPHAVTRLSDAPPAERMASCVACHDDREMMARHGVPTDAVASYRRSFHYKAIRFGEAHTASCPDCHTAHHILPASDSASTVAAGNLTQTCGQAGCHAGAERNFAVSGANHLDLRVDRTPVLFVEEKFFFLLTAGTMAMLVVGIVLDVQRKFNWLMLARRVGAFAGRHARTVARLLAGRLLRLRPVAAVVGRTAFHVMRRVLYD